MTHKSDVCLVNDSVKGVIQSVRSDRRVTVTLLGKIQYLLQ